MGASTFIPLTSFAVACLLSTWPGNWLIRRAYGRILNRTPWFDEDPAKTGLREFLTSTARTIGTLERFILIYAMSYSQPSLITGVVILKAFFAWTQSPRTPVRAAATGNGAQGAPAPEEAEEEVAMMEVVAHYHTYIIGNFLSLLIAIGLYAAAQYLFPPLIQMIWERLSAP